MTFSMAIIIISIHKMGWISDVLSHWLFMHCLVVFGVVERSDVKTHKRTNESQKGSPVERSK